MDNKVSTERFEQIREYVRAHLATAPGCHDFDHTMRVLNNAIKLHEAEQQGNLTVIKLAALLHDIARPEEMQSEGKLCHAELGAEMTVEILQNFKLEDHDFITRVSAAVRKHRYRDSLIPETIEEKIIYDADKLDAIGSVGIGRAFHFAGRVGARLHNTADEALNSDAYSIEDSAYREYLVKLQHIPEKMLTESGKKMAQVRAQFMHDFFARLNADIFDA